MALPPSLTNTDLPNQSENVAGSYTSNQYNTLKNNYLLLLAFARRVFEDSEVLKIANVPVLTTDKLPDQLTGTYIKNGGSDDFPVIEVDVDKIATFLTTNAVLLNMINNMIATALGQDPPQTTPSVTFNDTAKTATVTVVSGKVIGDYEFTQDAGATIVTATSATMSVTVLPNAINRVGFRLKADSSHSVSAWAYNQIAYTSSSGSGNLLPGYSFLNIRSGTEAGTIDDSVPNVYTNNSGLDYGFVSAQELPIGGRFAFKLTAFSGFQHSYYNNTTNPFDSSGGIATESGAVTCRSGNNNTPFASQPVLNDYLILERVTGGSDSEKTFKFYKTSDMGTTVVELPNPGEYIRWGGTDVVRCGGAINNGVTYRYPQVYIP